MIGTALSGPAKEMLHVVSQVLLVPTIVVLLGLIAYTIYQIGSVLVEYFGERRRLNQSIPALVRQINEAPVAALGSVVENSGLLRRQKSALAELLSYKELPFDSLDAISRRILSTEEEFYAKRTSRTDLIARVAPMFGLMGTLIPLGPGIVALSSGDTQTLSSSLLTAFDTTVSGLIAAAVAYFISMSRKRWYISYMISLESAMIAILDRLAEERYLEEGVSND